LKKSKMVLAGLLIVIIAILTIVFMMPSPKKNFERYLSYWENQDFSGMYSLLSDNSKGKISEENFVKRYKNIYEGIEVSNLSTQINSSEKITKDKEGKAEIAFDLSMDTLAGNVAFSHRGALVKQGINWYLDWNTGMIFPELKLNDKVSVQMLAGKRGEIIDRDGNRLAANGVAIEIGIVPQRLEPNREALINQISTSTGISVEQINKKLSQTWVKQDSFVPLLKMSEDENEKIKLLTSINGITKKKVSSRVYYYKEAAAHLIGYVGQINKEEFEKLRDEGYKSADTIGKAGLEQVFEKRLKGHDGWEIYIKDVYGEKTKTIAVKDPKDGENIKLTIDAELQRAAYNQINQDSGNAVAIQPKTGEILAMVSSPSYDPNSFVLGISQEEWGKIRDNPDKPMLNRFSQTYAPGSAFKPIIAAIGFKKGSISEGTAVNVKGLKWQKDSSWGNYYITRVKDTGRPVNLRDALVYSDNIYFAQAALNIKAENLVEESKNFGFGEEFGLPYYVKPSQIADKESMKSISQIQLADSGYGQGKVLTSPLHIASMYTAFLNHGNVMKPYMEVKESQTSNIWHENVFSDEVAEIIVKNLIQVVEDPAGSGHEAKIKDRIIAGKTGTAEIKQSKSDTGGTENGWFVSFDARDSKILLVMMIENVKGRGGSHYVVPKSKAVLQYFLNK
jgi:penicillin-binding protein 3